MDDEKLAMDAGCTMFPCTGGCGEPMAFPGACPDCAYYAEHYDAKEVSARLERLYALRDGRMAGTAKESAHLGAVERDPRRGLFRFLDWKTSAPSAGHASAARLDGESAAAPAAGDPERRSELLAELPRVDCGVRRMSALPRVELWSSGIPLCTVAVVLAWDVLRWIGCVALDAVACFCRRRDLRGRLAVTGFVAGSVLGLAVSALAWGMR